MSAPRATTPRPIPNRPFEALVTLLALDPIWPMPGWENTNPDGVLLPPTGPLSGHPVPREEMAA